MKEMIYQKDRKVEVLHSGEYKGYKFAILNLGTHPTAYVENKAGFEESGEADDFASPHGSFTYCGKAYWDKEDLTPYIGWDYAHCDDYAGYYDENSDIYLQGLKKWTAQEIFDEVKEVIDTLIKNTQEDRKLTDIDKMVELLSNACQASAKYFHEKVKKAFENGEKHLSRRDGKLKTILEFQAEALVNAGIGDTKQAVREFAERLKEFSFPLGKESYIRIGCIEELVKEVCGE